MIKVAVFFLFFCFLVFPSITFATSDVLLNEIVVDQSPQSIELLNVSSENRDISSWYLDDNAGTSFFTVPDNTIIYAHSCMVFANEFNLNKSSADMARLFDATAPPTSPSAHLLDSYSYNAGPGGLLSFSRIPDGETWSTASASLGNVNSTGQSCIVVPTSTPTPTVLPTTAPTAGVSVTPTPSQSAIANIHISEAMVNPNVGENEWIELYNDNDFDVNLANWYIDDVENTGSAPKQFSLPISAKSYAVYTLSTGMFNNETDSIRLLNSKQEVVDSFEYSISEKGKSIGRVDFVSDTFCDQTPSQNAPNSECSLMESLSPEPSQTILSTEISNPTYPPQLFTTIQDEVQSMSSPLEEKVDYASIFHPVKKTSIPKKPIQSQTVVLGESIAKKNVYLLSLTKVLPLISGTFPLLSVASFLLKRRVLK
jgi:hypothetical protein